MLALVLDCFSLTITAVKLAERCDRDSAGGLFTATTLAGFKLRLVRPPRQRLLPVLQPATAHRVSSKLRPPTW
jgi:hypothetical protein